MQSSDAFIFSFLNSNSLPSAGNVLLTAKKKAAELAVSYILSARVDTQFSTQGKLLRIGAFSVVFGFFFLTNTSSILVVVVPFKTLH